MEDEPDIVARLRVLASEFPTVNGWMDNEWTNAADEIERLHRDYSCICSQMRRMMEERDEARREAMSWISDQACRSEDVDEEYKKRGWEYLKENTNE